MIRVDRFIVAALVTCIWPAVSRAQPVHLQGQLSTWFVLNDGRPSTPLVGLRYIPTVMLERPLANERVFDGEVSLNAHAAAWAPDWREVDGTSAAKAYRVWARLKTTRFETRVGLQKINFGSATLLRPLMWFDSVDPRDPLQITDGVYGILFRSFLPNNVTVWTWGLYGNERIKGLEINPTADRTPEFGGRVQLPVWKGELAATTHHRRTDLSRGPLPMTVERPVVQEHRYALDGKWDLGVGLWFEGVLMHQRHPEFDRPDQNALTVGADYTFGVGNGLNVLGEYFVVERSAGTLASTAISSLSAASFRYPLGVLDTFFGIVYYDADRDDTYRFLTWQRSYDRWQFHVMGFWNPLAASILPGQQTVGPSPFSGRGFQLLLVFNH
jgi:hypothetical protein